MRLSKEQARAILASRKMIAAPGKYSVKVTSVTPYTDDAGNSRHICNFAAMTPAHISGWENTESGEQVQGVKQLLAAGNYDDACNLNLSSGQRPGRDYIPSKGEVVDIEVERITTSNGVAGLFVTSVVGRKAEQATNVNVDSLFGEDEDDDAAPADDDADVFNVDTANPTQLRAHLRETYGWKPANYKGMSEEALIAAIREEEAAA